MPDEQNERFEQVARELKKPVHLSSALDERVMRAVRSLPKHSRFGFWSRLTTPRRVSVSPLSWGLIAATILVFATLGTWNVVRDAGREVRPIASALLTGGRKATPPQPVQFVLVAPEAKKVAVVGDFNGWDASHAGYQAQHRGSGVWAVTAALPLGHHRYSFVVDDSLWVADPIAPRAVDNDFGVANSAIVVQNHE